jgi:hypothetical protein
VIVYPQSFVLGPPAPASPALTYPRIGYKNYALGLAAAAVTVSGETATGPKDAPLRPDTAEFWQPQALPATWTLDLGQARAVDYVGLAGHTLGTNAAVVKVSFDSDATLPDPYLSLPGVAGNYASTPDTAANSVTGDIDVRVRINATNYTPAATQALFGKYNPTGNQRSWLLEITATGTLTLATSPNGTTVRSHVSSVATGLVNGTVKWLRVTRTAADGVVKFWMSDDNITYVQLGANVAGFVEGIFDSTAPLEVGTYGIGGSDPFVGRTHYAELRNGVGGAVVASFNPADALEAATSWVSSQTGETWTVNGVTARVYNNVFAASYSPVDDTPLLFLNTSRTGRYLKLTITGAGAVPRVAVVYVGPALAMQKMVSSPYKPVTMARDTVLSQSLSRGGQFLGQSFRRNGVMSSTAFRNLTAAWVRANFDDFSKSARSLPYFFAWNPSQYPQEVAYVWTDKDIVPVYQGLSDLMDVSWSMRGIGQP